MLVKPKEQRELFYWGDDHQAHDAELHQSILDQGDHAAAQRVSRQVGKRIGLSDADIDALLGKSKP